MDTSAKHPGGRPTNYTSETVQKAEEYIWQAKPENQDIATVEGLALHLGVTRDTIYEWAKVYPEFSDTLSKLKLNQKVDLIKTGIFGGKEINANIIALMLKVNHNMVETTHTDVTSGGKPLPLLSALDVRDNNGTKEAEETQQEN